MITFVDIMDITGKDRSLETSYVQMLNLLGLIELDTSEHQNTLLMKTLSNPFSSYFIQLGIAMLIIYNCSLTAEPAVEEDTVHGATDEGCSYWRQQVTAPV